MYINEYYFEFTNISKNKIKEQLDFIKTEGVLPSAMSLKERRAKALEEERRLTYVAITRAEKAFYMTESEGFNFSTGLNKYPTRFLFEISENYFVRKGKLSQEIINEAKEQLKLSSTRQLIQKKFEVGEMVNHLIWKKGKVIKVNEEKGEYQIEFIGIGKTKPINFEFKGLTKIGKKIELTNEENLKNSKPDEDDYSAVDKYFKKRELQKIDTAKPKKITKKKEIHKKRIDDLKKEMLEIEKVSLETSKSQLITESKIIENGTSEIIETDGGILRPTTYKSNTGNDNKPQEKDKNNLWSKLKELWS